MAPGRIFYVHRGTEQICRQRDRRGQSHGSRQTRAVARNNGFGGYRGARRGTGGIYRADRSRSSAWSAINHWEEVADRCAGDAGSQDVQPAVAIEVGELNAGGVRGREMDWVLKRAVAIAKRIGQVVRRCCRFVAIGREDEVTLPVAVQIAAQNGHGCNLQVGSDSVTERSIAVVQQGCDQEWRGECRGCDEIRLTVAVYVDNGQNYRACGIQTVAPRSGESSLTLIDNHVRGRIGSRRWDRVIERDQVRLAVSIYIGRKESGRAIIQPERLAIGQDARPVACKYMDHGTSGRGTTERALRCRVYRPR